MALRRHHRDIDAFGDELASHLRVRRDDVRTEPVRLEGAGDTDIADSSPTPTVGRRI
jgi:hypothetical protein